MIVKYYVSLYTKSIKKELNTKSKNDEIFVSFIIDILRQRTKDVEVKKYCIHLLEKLGSFEYTRNILTRLDAEARAEVSIFFLIQSNCDQFE